MSKKEKVNPGHYPELLDRIHLSICNIDDHILHHPATDKHKKIRKKIEAALDNLAEAYQITGQISYDKTKTD